MNDELKFLIEQYVKLVDSDENKKRNACWEIEPVYTKDRFRRIAKPWKETGCVPLTLQYSISLRSLQYGFSLKKFYTDPETFIINYLKIFIEHFKLNDSLTLDRVIPCWPGTTLEASMFGGETLYSDLEDPALSIETVLKEHSDLDKLKMPDFFESGLMPLMHRYYSEINEVLKGTGCSLAFPELIRSPFGIAFQIRGFENLCFDLMDSPEWVHSLMRFLTDAHKKWYIDRAKFLGQDIPLGHLYNDEVDCNLFGPNIYEEFILPYEIELSKFHGGIAYWHSCGNIAPVLKHIRKIPDIKLLNISPWTDYKTASEVCPDIPLEITLNTTKDIFMADETKMRERVQYIIDTCTEHNVKAFHINTSMLTAFLGDVSADLAKGEQWLRVAKEVANLK